MSQVIRERNTPRQCFSTIRLDSGELVMVSVARSGVKIFRMKWGGLVPGETLWESTDLARIAALFFNPERPTEHPLESIRNAVLKCHSSADVRALAQ